MAEKMLAAEEKTPETEEMVTAETEIILAEEEPIAPPEEMSKRILEIDFLDFRKLIKKPLFWEIAVGVVVAVCLLIFVLMALAKPAESTQETAAETLAFVPETTAAATVGGPPEPTYLPIDRNPIGMTDFAPTAEGFLTCVATPSVLGIDVSEWQGGEIDWQQVKQAGVEFVMIRVGWRGSEKGVLTADTYAQTNYAGASAAGLKVGAYIFSQAITPAEAMEEANYLLDAVKDWNVEMPLVFDWEFIDAASRTANMDARTLTDCAIAFCETIKTAGYTPMVYFNTNQSMELLYLVELEDYLFWLAQYNGGGVLKYDYKIDMWQYTETGKVPGINGNVDINLYFPYEE